MNTTRGSSARVTYRARLIELSRVRPEDPEEQAHWAKYLCILISGYLEQSVKDVVLEFSTSHSALRLSNYIESSWPRSRNMNIDNIKDILKKFEPAWRDSFVSWLQEDDRRKTNIDALMRSRNDIAHGKEANTNSVTLSASKQRMEVAFELIEFLEGLVLEEEEAEAVQVAE
ncbi:hypothetical protein K3X13_10830 [Aliiroseovarius crassostreae]|uniref:HEPN domain-containing protein n=1 Tax=Aliiroseovarius crassostreae TaxID=154981 RepID=UPI002202CAAD|nr:HEPN domain-containing protein [Aliiroseovarius crassostreae]UWP91553.1 hypothetical protein K3X13_10830 [Aliiroseovarius crassostreae]